MIETGFPGGSDSKDSACNVGAPNSILESRDSYNYMCAQNFLFSRSDMRYWDVIQMPCSLLVSHHWLGIYVHVVWKDQKPLLQLRNYFRNEVLKCATSGYILNVSPWNHINTMSKTALKNIDSVYINKSSWDETF